MLVAPRPGPGITWAAAALDSRHGHIAVRWEKFADQLVVDVELPDGVTGILDIAGHDPVELAAGTHRLTKDQDR